MTFLTFKILFCVYLVFYEKNTTCDIFASEICFPRKSSNQIAEQMG